MRGPAFGLLAFSLAVVVGGCRTSPSTRDRFDARGPAPGSSSPAPGSSAVAAVQRELQTTRLALPARRRHLPRLVFGAGVLARLRDSDVQVLDERSFTELIAIPLEQPRALVAMADGALVAVGGNGSFVRWERGRPVSVSRARVVLFPDAELYADAQQPDILWVLEPDRQPPALHRHRIGDGSATGVLLPEQSIELRSPPGGTFGVTREGVWLYVTPERVDRLAPSGLTLPALSGPGPGPTPTWALPARRVDQSVWVNADGGLIRTLVSPVRKSLATAQHGGRAYAAEVGDEGRLLALVAVTGAGPRFELSLFDAELRERGRAPLPADSPTGQPDWVRAVTRNQELAVAPREARVALGGPDRLTIFDGAGRVIFSFPIK